MDKKLEGLTPESLSLFLDVIIEPVLNEDSDGPEAQNLRAALKKAERYNPGVAKDLILGILQAKRVKVDLTTVLLKLCATESEEFKITQKEPLFLELQKQSQSLKTILATLPEVTEDRPNFLKTIKAIARGIQEMLEVVKRLSGQHEAFNNEERRGALESHRKDFVHSTKAFSDSLKTFFNKKSKEDKEEEDNSRNKVYISAINIVTEVNTILKMLRNL